MTSILKVDNIQKANGSTPTAGDLGINTTGTILQTVVHQELGMTTFTAGSQGTDKLLIAANAADSTSHLSLSITPKSTNSKILLTTSVFYEGSSTNNYDYLWTLYRDSTKLGQPHAGEIRGGIMSNSIGYYSAADPSTTPDSVSFSYYDTPNTTSAITYAVAFNHSINSVLVYLNRTVADSNSYNNERGVSILIAQEIGG
jgi:hypothetical protein